MGSAGNDFLAIAKELGIDISKIKPESLEEAAERHQKQSEQYTKQYLERKYSLMFSKDSIFNDPDLKHASFNNFEVINKEQNQNKYSARQFAYEYTQGNHFNTLLVGEAGRGKTHLAIGMLKAVNKYMQDRNKFYGCLFMDVNQMMSRIMNYEFHGGDSKYSRYNMEKLCGEANLLVLDDLGTESTMKSDDTEANNMTQRVLYNILNARNDTIITTNLSSSQLYKVYNSKLASRIKRNLGKHVIKFTDKTQDMRQADISW